MPHEDKIDHEITDPIRRATQLKMWDERKSTFFQKMGKLIDEGGSDYDGTDVNFDTIAKVLRGDKSKSDGRPVVEYNENTKVFLTLFSHGNWLEVYS